MRKNLKMLDELQTIDLKIDGYKGEKEALQGEIAVLDVKVAEAQSTISEKQGELALLNEEIGKLEEGIAAEAENIRRTEAHQKEIKTQKEYQAVSREIATAKKLSAELEEQLLQKMGQTDELKTAITGIEETLSALEQNFTAQKGEVQSKIEPAGRGYLRGHCRTGSHCQRAARNNDEALRDAPGTAPGCSGCRGEGRFVPRLQYAASPPALQHPLPGG